jgi:hypothetical protein
MVFIFLFLRFRAIGIARWSANDNRAASNSRRPDPGSRQPAADKITVRYEADIAWATSNP